MAGISVSMVVLELGTIWPIRKLFMISLTLKLTLVTAGQLHALRLSKGKHQYGRHYVGNGRDADGRSEADQRNKDRYELDTQNRANTAEVETESRCGRADAGRKKLGIPRAEAAEVP